MLHDYQQEGVKKALSFAQGASSKDRLMLAAPTGTGKSYVERALLDALPDWWLLTPSIDIITGMLEKLGEEDLPNSDADLVEVAMKYRICTPLRFKNLLMSGANLKISGIIVDEGHHDESQTHHDIDTLCDVPKIALTATPYRGTPAGSAALLAKWGKPHWLITEEQAAARGFLSMPVLETWPLVDDDLIEVQNGELVISQITAATKDKLEHFVSRYAPFCDAEGRPTRPTVISVPSTEVADDLMQKMQAAGLKASMIAQGCPRVVRHEIYNRGKNSTHAVINVRVIGEGVDVPFRRYFDLSPTMSPVLWRQRIGRIMRPTDTPPEYYCTNRNLMRFFYLLGSALPPAGLSATISAFGNLSSRLGARAFGLESLGRLRPVECRLTDGLSVHCYSVSATEQGRQRQYFVIVHPAQPNPLWCVRENTSSEGVIDWGKWRVTEPPSELTGFRSLPNSPISPRQKEWWEKAASRYGIDDLEQKVTTKLFPILPVLSQIRVKLV